MSADSDVPEPLAVTAKLAVDQVEELLLEFLGHRAAEVTPIRSIDDTEIGNGSRGPITREIQQHFFDLVEGQLGGYDEWFDYV